MADFSSYDAIQQRHQQAPQQQQQQQGGGWQRQSQQQGGTPPQKTPRTTADPGADGQTVYDVQDEERRKAEGDDEARADRARHTPPDSNAI